MIDIYEQKNLANQLRKSGNIDAALSIYEKLWEVSKDEFDGAGFLHCLRKKNQYEKAIPLAGELLEKFPSFEWVRNEIIWTYISGRLMPLDDSSFSDILSIAREIMILNPDAIARRKVVFKVLKSAKRVQEWEIMSQWIDLIDPEILSPDPIMIQPAFPVTHNPL